MTEIIECPMGVQMCSEERCPHCQSDSLYCNAMVDKIQNDKPGYVRQSLTIAEWETARKW